MYQSVAEYFSGIHLQYRVCHHVHNIIRLRDSDHARVLRQRDGDDCFRDLPDNKLYCQCDPNGDSGFVDYKA